MSIDFDSRSAKELFLRYAIPCGQVLVGRGWIGQGTLDRLREKLMKGEEINDDIKDVFKVGVVMCQVVAGKMGKKAIDEAVVRRYFWEEHEKAVRWRASVFPDVIPERCDVYPGVVLDASGGEARVRTPKGDRKCRKDLAVGLEASDLVVVHYDYVIEKIGRKDYEKLLKGAC